MSDDFLTYKQTASYLNLPIATLYTLVSKKRIPFYRISGRIIRFSKAELIAWINRGANMPHTDLEDRKIDASTVVKIGTDQ